MTNSNCTQHFIYVLYSDQYDKIYVGYSCDVEKRLAAHNHLKNKGWTKRYQPWKIVYIEKFDIKRLALQREKQLKTAGGRRFIREDILASLKT